MHSRDLPIRFPCPDPNKQLSSVPGQLYCATCDRQVIELNRLTGAEVRSLKRRAAAGERICVRYRADENGLIELRRSPPMRPLRAAAAAAGLALLVGGSARADTSLPPAPRSHGTVVDATRARRATSGGTSSATTQTAPAPAPAKAAPPKRARWVDYDGGI